MRVNAARVWLGGIAGGIVWNAWSFFIGMRQGPLYEAMQKQGLFLEEVALSIFRGTMDSADFCNVDSAGVFVRVESRNGRPRTENGGQDRHDGGILRGRSGQLRAGSMVSGSACAALGWMLDLWAGSILATLVAGFLYKE